MRLIFYTTGAIWVAGDGNLVSGNIRKGVSIFGVGGSFEGPVSNPYYLWNGSFQNGQSLNDNSVVSGSVISVKYGGVWFINAIDVTPYKFLKVYCTRADNTKGTKFTFGLRNVSTNVLVTLEDNAYQPNASYLTHFLDISGFSGLHRVTIDNGYYEQGGHKYSSNMIYSQIYFNTV